MKNLLPLRYLCFFLVILFLSSLSSLVIADENLNIRVRKGDSLSYLSFKIYGRYDPEIAEILRKENPQVKDMDLVYPGQELRFPTPDALRKKLGERVPEPVKPGLAKEAKDPRVSAQPSQPQPPVSATQARATKGVITFLEGKVQAKRAAESQWSTAGPNMILSENDQIHVLSGSRAELILDNQSVMRLSENTLLTIRRLEEEKATKAETARMDVSLGKLWVRVAKLFNPASRYDVKTPTVIAGVQGTTYQIIVTGDQSTTIQVFEGAVNVYNPFPGGDASQPEKPTQVKKPQEVAGPREVPGPTSVSREEWTQIVLQQLQQVTVTGREIPHPISLDLQKERQNEWVRWNEERDADFKPPERPR